MEAGSRNTFVILIAAQTMHSIEEYLFGFADVFVPIRFLSELICISPEVFFIVANIAVVMFGGWCYLARVRPAHPAAVSYAWLWIIVEIVNGAGHISIAIYQGSYFPGVGTAPLLFGIALYLGYRLTLRKYRN